MVISTDRAGLLVCYLHSEQHYMEASAYFRCVLRGFDFIDEIFLRHSILCYLCVTSLAVLGGVPDPRFQPYLSLAIFFYMIKKSMNFLIRTSMNFLLGFRDPKQCIRTARLPIS